MEVLHWLRRPSPAGHHVRGGATARHVPPSRAWRRPPAPRMTGPLTSRLPGTPRLPASREGVQRRATTIALVLVREVTCRTCHPIIPRFATPLSTTCGCAIGQQQVRQRRHRYLFLPLVCLLQRMSSLPCPGCVTMLQPTFPPPRCTRGASNVIDPGCTMCTFLLPLVGLPQRRLQQKHWLQTRMLHLWV